MEASKDLGGNRVEVPAQADTTQVYSFDELARGLADGTITRGRMLKLISAAVMGSVLTVLFPGVAVAKRRKRKRCPPGTVRIRTRGKHGKGARCVATSTLGTTCSLVNPIGTCPTGQACVNGACVPVTCSPANPTGACPTGQVCIDGACQASPGSPPVSPPVSPPPVSPPPGGSPPPPSPPTCGPGDLPVPDPMGGCIVTPCGGASAFNCFCAQSRDSLSGSTIICGQQGAVCGPACPTGTDAECVGLLGTGAICKADTGCCDQTCVPPCGGCITPCDPATEVCFNGECVLVA